LGHHNFGFRSRSSGCAAGSSFTLFADDAATVMGISNAASPKRPRSLPATGRGSWLRSVISIPMSAREVSGSGSVVVTSGSSIVTGPLPVRYTLFQMPVSRPRTAGIQSQPIEAWNVGLSAPSAPPLLPKPVTVFSLVDPGVWFFSMRTASAFAWPMRSLPVTSKRPRINAPSMRPSFSPFK
jgi:hypothetical protein